MNDLNPFDAAVLGFVLVATVAGFRAGLLRSLATILAYAIAAPAALLIGPAAGAWLTARGLMPPNVAPYAPFIALVAIGMVLGAMMRAAVGGATGGHMVLADRLLGALLGACRIGLLAILLVLIFERLIPAGREPDWLKQSQLRPYLSAAGAQGLRVLPPSIVDTVDRLKRERGI